MPRPKGPNPFYAMVGVGSPSWEWETELYCAGGIWITVGDGDEVAVAESSMLGTVGEGSRQVG